MKLYGTETITAIGPKITVEFPFSAINSESSSATTTFFTLPYTDLFNKNLQNAYDYRILLGDGSEIKTQRLYSLKSGVRNSVEEFLALIPSNNRPTSFKIVVQPVTITKP